MRRWIPLALVALAGCSGDDSREGLAKTATPDPTVQLAGKAGRVGDIAMAWEGAAVHVGDGWEAAQGLFPERRGSYRLRSLPGRFGREFEAHGWETNDGEGYGVVSTNDLVVAAVYHAEGVDEDAARKLVAAQRAVTGALPMSEAQNGNRRWEFWERDGQRLMVLVVQGRKGADVTVLMGDGNVLDALGATRPTPSDLPTAASQNPLENSETGGTAPTAPP